VNEQDPGREPSQFWQELGAEHARELDRYGFETVKRHQALRYFSWRWNLTAAVRSAQLRFLLRRTPSSSWRTAWRHPELADDAWAELDWSRLERRLATFAIRLLWMYASRWGDPEVLALPEPSVGAPLPIELDGRLISQDLANSSIEIAALREALPANPPRSFLEVGAGYGRTAYALLSLFPDAVYTIVDIPPAIDISRWYLGQLFAPERLRFVDPSAVEDIEWGSIDVSLSISSLQEMTPDLVAGYLELFDRVGSGGIVYLKQWTRWRNEDDGLTMEFSAYPFPSRWQRSFVRTAPVQTGFTEAAWTIPVGPDVT
jgi:putative sugar O-methyltransferase